jgi:hypothetical protein
MRAFHISVLAFVLMCSATGRRLEAQQPDPRSQLTLDASVLAGGISYARTTSSHKVVGVGAGVGNEFNIRLVPGDSWLKKSAEVGHVDVFQRFAPPGRWRYDLGVKVAVDVHTERIASEPLVGAFLGGFVAPMWGGRHFQIGPRLQAGTFWSSASPAFGISVTPITARLLF